ncbi:MAG: bifunctional (p)ppGpp synthetase/guanosine-3',5'-bis(diphosphate) 3'-pyrophosphohydrolase [Anaerolineales bacterium]|nr:bifunctional (p)ppGpp synthetase/guanosine-3',5'-bis(diphosphate) 3'-pyrophosphohydrolase [Anaerolineales bacterium]
MKSTQSSATIEDLLKRLPEKFTAADRELVKRAYQVAEEAHREQKRHSGEPYIIHCVAVAKILSEMKVQPEVIAAGLLHDTVEDTSITLDDLSREFGDTVRNLVDGVTKLTHLPRVSRGDQHAEDNGAAEENHSAPALLGRKEDIVSETLRKTFIAMGKDVRVMFIKLADRLHNMRTLDYMPEHKRKRIAKETLEIFAPVANRLGIWQIKWVLEDLAFSYDNPEKYKEIAGLLAEKRPEREAQLEEIKTHLVKLLKSHNIKAEVSGRPKHIYSIYKKMQKKGKSFDMVRDIRAVRLIVADVPSCYAALGVIHTTWRPIPGEFDDYIAAPKNNFYQSLHTAIFYEDKRPLEIQIRTPAMHMKSEYGVAAHWRYKEGGKGGDKNYESFISSLRSMVEMESEARDANEFVETMRQDVFQDRVYIFTPRGDIIDLPVGSTPIDFAYHVHTDIGHNCRGAHVNGKMVSLDHKLKTGDQVEIILAPKRGGGPSRDWLNSHLGLVQTQRARAKIKTWFKKQEDDLNLMQGRAALESELQKLGLNENVNFEKMARSLNLKNPEDMFLALGNGDLTINKVLKQFVQEEEADSDIFKVNPSAATATATDAIEVVGLKGMLSSMAQCCNPTPGDPIVGYITRGRGATIHRQDCPNILQTKEHERLLRVGWGRSERTFPVPIYIKAYDRPGLVSDVSNLLTDENINITDVTVNMTEAVANLRLIIEVRDITQLSRVLTRIDNLPNIMEVHRVKPG